jgi:hypothetical protein
MLSGAISVTIGAPRSCWNQRAVETHAEHGQTVLNAFPPSSNRKTGWADAPLAGATWTYDWKKSRGFIPS